MVCQSNADPGKPTINGPNAKDAVTLGPVGVKSGLGDKENKPASEYDRNGPIPEGQYKMNKSDIKDGHDRFRLEPYPNGTIDRTLRDIEHPRFDGLGAQLHRGTVSDGCINADQNNPGTMRQFDQVLNLLNREAGSNYLTVVK
jgi:hypothetical protein